MVYKSNTVTVAGVQLGISLPWNTGKWVNILSGTDVSVGTKVVLWV